MFDYLKIARFRSLKKPYLLYNTCIICETFPYIVLRKVHFIAVGDIQWVMAEI